MVADIRDTDGYLISLLLPNHTYVFDGPCELGPFELPAEAYRHNYYLHFNLSVDLDNDGVWDIYNEVNFSVWADILGDENAYNKLYVFHIYKDAHLPMSTYALYNMWGPNSYYYNSPPNGRHASVLVRAYDAMNNVLQECYINTTTQTNFLYHSWYPGQAGLIENWPTTGVVSVLPENTAYITVHVELMHYELVYDPYDPDYYEYKEVWEHYDRTYVLNCAPSDGDIYGIGVCEDIPVGIGPGMELLYPDVSYGDIEFEL